MQTHPEPRTHADELDSIAAMLTKHGERGHIRDLAVDALRDIAGQVREWRNSTGPAVHHGALPDGVVDLTWWKKQRRVTR